MAASSSPYGIKVISDQSGIVRPIRMPKGIVSGLAANIFKYQAVKLVNGLLQPVTNNGGVPDPIFGIFAGCEFTPLGGRPTESPFFPSGTNWDPNYDMFAYFWPAWTPNLRFQVQADGAVAQALMGSQFNITNLAAGSTSIGLSTCTVGAAGIAVRSQGQFALTEFATSIGDPDGGGDAFTDLICTLAYPQVGSAFQPSIG